MLTKFREGVPAALLLGVSIAFLLPSTLYAGGAATTGLTYGIFLLVAAVMTAVLTAVFAGAYAAIKAPFDLRLVYFALSLALLIKAVLLPSAVPVLDGETQFARTMSTPGLLAIGTILLALIVGGVVAARFGVRFVGILTAVVVAIGLQPLLDPDNRENMFGAPKRDTGAFFQFAASEPNVLVMLIDTFQADAFAETLTANPDLQSSFEGFTYFYNTTSTAPYTLMALMPIYSGRTYEGGSIRSFYRTSRNDSVFTDFNQQGYASTIGGHYYFSICPANACFQRWVLYENPPIASAFSQYLEVFDYSLLRIVPTRLQSFFYNAGAGRFRSLIKLPDRAGPAEGSVAAMEALTQRMNTDSDQPTFKFFHVMTTHSPVTMNAACQNIGEQPLTREAYSAQAECAVRRLADILNALRERNIYDNTTIVILSDHGASIRGRAPNTRFLGEVRALSAQNGGRFNALYLVKPARAEGPLRLSAAPAQNSDLRATLCAIAIACGDTVPGENPFALPANSDRRRTFIDYGAWVHRYTSDNDSMPPNGFVRFSIGPSPDSLPSTYDPQRRQTVDAAAQRAN